MRNKVISAKEAVAKINDGAVIMVGGFMACGTPEILIDAMIEKDLKNLTIICNDGGFPNRGVGRLISRKMVTRLITSHVGLNPLVAAQMNEGFIQLDLVPQGTLAERISCAGKGIGGFYTPTGVGTVVAENKETKEINGKKYLLELALHADFALLRGSITDKAGNVFYKKATRNFNPLMATAAKTVICAAEQLVDVGELAPDHVITPGVYVDFIVEGEPVCRG